MMPSTKNSKKETAQTCSIRIVALLTPGKKKKRDYLVVLFVNRIYSHLTSCEQDILSRSLLLGNQPSYQATASHLHLLLSSLKIYR